MSEQTPLSDEVLNAYLDGELDEDTEALVFEAVRHDQEAWARLCVLRNAQDVLRHAYRKPPRPRGGGQGPAPRRGARLWRAAAAAMLLVAGAVAGWIANEGLDTRTTLASARAHQPSIEQLLRSPSAAGRIILHVANGDPERLRSALDNAEQLLQRAKRQGKDVRLEVIANAGGLDLLRADTSPYGARITRMDETYTNLRLMACQKAIQRLEEQGVDVKLLPESEIASSALEQIVKRMQEGWVYIKV